ILYESLTGKPPFRGETRTETLALVKGRAPVPPRKLRPEVPAELDWICLHCLQKQIGQRYGSAAALAADLQAWLDDKSLVLPQQRGLRRRWLAALSAGVLLAGLAVAVWLLAPIGN